MKNRLLLEPIFLKHHMNSDNDIKEKSNLADLKLSAMARYFASTAIVAALEDEIAQILLSMNVVESLEVAGRKFWLATYHGKKVVIVLSGIGKVAAAITTICLIKDFGVSKIVFTGVAGGVSDTLNIGDIVVGTQFVQHDMDASPLFPRYVVPGYKSPYFSADEEITKNLLKACEKALKVISEEGAIYEKFKLKNAQTKCGEILSGDQFIANSDIRNKLSEEHPQALAVEMEGAAVAQVCLDFGIKFGVVRTISDAASDSAEIDFTQFLTSVASRYSALIIKEYLEIS